MYKITYPDSVGAAVRNLLENFNQFRKDTRDTSFGLADDIPEIPIGEVEFYLGKETGNRLLAIREKDKRIVGNINRIILEMTTCDMYWHGIPRVAARMLQNALRLKTDDDGLVEGVQLLLYIDRFLRNYLGTMYGLTPNGREFQKAINQILEWIMHMAHSLLEEDDYIAEQEPVDVPELEPKADGSRQ